MVLYVILFFVATCIGMAISVYAFGTGGKRKKIFQDIYFLSLIHISEPTRQAESRMPSSA